MYRNVLLIIIFAVLIGLQTVGAVPLRPNVAHNNDHDFMPMGIVSSSSASSSAVSYVSLDATSIPTSGTVHSSSSQISTTLTSFTPHTTHALNGTPPLSANTTTLPQPASTTSLPLPLVSNASPTTSPPTPSSSSSSGKPPVSSSVLQELPTSISPSSSALPLPSTTSTNIAPVVRHVLIAVLTGIPTLTVLAYLITLRYRRAHRRSENLASKLPFDSTGAGKERKGTRFSSFFGVSHGNEFQEKDGRKSTRQIYATSIHSSAGLAGVGAHRGASNNGVPPMITYVKLPESCKMAEADGKANFENPFGTPRPGGGGFAMAPSRVSPQIPPMPSLYLVQLPSIALQNHSRAGQNTEWKEAPVLNLPGDTGHDMSRPVAPHPVQPHQGNQGSRSTLKRLLFGPVPPSTAHDFLSPHPPATAWTDRQSPGLELAHSPDPPRTSVGPSVYGGITSPRTPALVNPTVTPLLPYLVPTPRPERTPVLPYLSSPTSNLQQAQEERQTIGPVIIIEAASTIDSMSEYGDDVTAESDGETWRSLDKTSDNILAESVAQGSTRRDGLVGSPAGYMPPSTTFSTASSYSSCSVSGNESSTASSLGNYGSASSSGRVMPSSSSDGSTITVRATTVRPGQFRRADLVEETLQSSDSLWLPENFDELERGRRLDA